MDPLSQLLRWAGLEARLDLRCQFAETYAVDHAPAPAGDIVFHLVLAGECRIELAQGAPIAMRTGDFVALPHGAPHRLRSAGGDPVRQASMHWAEPDASGLPLRRNHAGGEGAADLDLLCGRLSHAPTALSAALFRSLPEALHVPLADTPAGASLAALVGLIRQEVEAAGPGAATIVAALSGVLFTLALRAQAQRDGETPGLMRLAGDARLARAAQAMLREPGRDWDLTQLAEAAAMSRATFARRFAEIADTTPGDFLLQLRMARAAELLRQTRRSAADIAAEVGYQSEAAFGKAFKKALGASPGAFRRQPQRLAGT